MELIEEKGVWKKYFDKDFQNYFYINKFTDHKTYVKPDDYDEPRKKKTVQNEQRKSSYATFEEDMNSIMEEVVKENTKSEPVEEFKTPKPIDKKVNLNIPVSNLNLPLKNKGLKSLESSPRLSQEFPSGTKSDPNSPKTPTQTKSDNNNEIRVFTPKTEDSKESKRNSIFQKASSFFFHKDEHKEEKVLEKKSSLWDGLKKIVSPRRRSSDERSLSSLNLQALLSPRKIKDFYNSSLDDIMIGEKNEIPGVLSKMIAMIKEKIETEKIFLNDVDIEALKKDVHNKGSSINFKNYTVHQYAIPDKLIQRDYTESFEKVLEIEKFLQLISLKHFISDIFHPILWHNSNLIQNLMELLYRIQLISNINKVTSKDLAKTFVNILFDTHDESDHQKLEEILILWIENYPKIYTEGDGDWYEKIKERDIGIIRQEYQLKQVDKEKWENVYSVLCKGKVLIYKDRNDFSNDGVPKCILLHDNVLVYSITDEKGHPYCYSIESHGNSHLFEANDEENRMKWVDSIRKSCSFKKKKVINATIGASMLSLPYVIKEAGYVLGVAMIIFGSFVALVSLQYLYEDVDPNIKDYEDIGYLSYGRVLSVIIKISIILGCFGTLVAFIDMISDFLMPVFKLIAEPDSILLQRWFATLMVSIPLFLISLIKRMSNLRFASYLNVLTEWAFLIFLFYSFLNPNSSSSSGVSKPIIISWSTIRVYGIVIFSFDCHTVLCGINYEFKRENHYRVKYSLYLAELVILVEYIFVAVFGYFLFLDSTNPNIFKSFSYEKKYWWNFIFSCLYGLTLTLVYPMIMYPLKISFDNFISPLWRWKWKLGQEPPKIDQLSEGNQKIFNWIWFKMENLRYYAYSFFFTLFAWIIAVYIPNVDSIFSIIGALFGSLICIVFPFMMYIKLTKKPWKHWSVILAIIGTIFGCFTCTILTIISIVDVFV